MTRRWWIAIGVAALIVVGVLVGLSLSGGSGSGSSAQLTGVAQANAEFAGLAQRGARVGPAAAPIRITEFGDLQCPACAEFATQTVPSLIGRWVRPGTASLTFRTISFIGPDSTPGAVGAQAAAEQNRVWPFVSLVYRNQGQENAGWLTQAYLRDVAAQVRGIDLARYNRALSSPAATAAYARDQALGNAQPVRATPHIVIEGPGGKRVLEGAISPAGMDATIQSVRAG